MGEGMTLEALRFLIDRQKVPASFRLRPYGEYQGMAIFFELRGGGYGSRSHGWLLAEKSKQVRVFARAETAFNVLRSLGATLLSVDLQPDLGMASFPRSLSSLRS